MVFKTMKLEITPSLGLKETILVSFYCCNKIPEAGYFIKKRGLFGLQFWRLNIQDWGSSMYLTSGETSWCIVSPWWEHTHKRSQEARDSEARFILFFFLSQ
jgi:hypothetical protein